MDEGPVWVALVDGRVVATASIVVKAEGIYIRGMAVLPGARGGNIGRLLLEHIEAYAAERGVKHLYLSTTPFLARAIRLYEHSGFRRTGRGPSEMFGTPLFTMEKCL
jgi:putative acetyltransferase